MMHRSYSMDWSPNALSPTSQKVFLQKCMKKYEKQGQELQNEISEKIELQEENEQLKIKLENLSKQFKSKTQENEKLKDDINELQINLENISKTLSEKCVTETEFVINNLNTEISDCKEYIKDLENENEIAKQNLKKCMLNVTTLTDEYISLENQNEELKKEFFSKNEQIDQLNYKCKCLLTETSDLKEYNQALKEELDQLKVKKYFKQENSESLGRELQFQFMKEEIQQMTNNLETIEKEQARLIAQNVDLIKEKADMNEKLNKLHENIEVIEKQNTELDGKLIASCEENECLKTQKIDLSMKLTEAENVIECCNRNLEMKIHESETLKTKLLLEKQEIEQKFVNLTNEHLALTLQLEKSIEDGKNYQISLTDMKTTLHNKVEEYAILHNNYMDLIQVKENYISMQKGIELELNVVRKEKLELENKLRIYSLNIEKLNEKQESLTDRCEMLQKKNLSLEKMFKDANNKILSLEKEKSNIVANCKNLEINQDKIVEEKKKLIIRIESLNSEICNYAKILNTSNSLLDNKTEECKRLCEDHETLITNYEELKQNNDTYSKLLIKTKDDLQETENNLLSCKIQYDNLYDEHTSLKDRYIVMKKNEEKCALLLKEANNRILHLGEENTELENNLKQLTKNYDSLNRDHNSLKNHSQNTSSENEKYQKMIQENTQRILITEAEKNETEKNLEEVMTNYNKLSADYQLLIVRYENLAAENECCIQNLKNANLALEEKTNKCNNLLETYTTLKNNFEELASCNNQHVKDLKEAVNRLQQIEEEKKEIGDELKSVNLQLQHLNDERNKLSTNYDILTKINETNENSIFEQNNKIHKLNEEKTEIEKNAVLLESSRNELIKLRDSLSLQLNNLLIENKCNMEKLTFANNEINRLTDQKFENERKYEESIKSFEELSEQCNALKTQISNLINENYDFKKTISNLKTEYEKKNIECNNLIEEKQTLSENYEKSLENNENYATTLKETQNELNSTKKNIDKLTKELKDYTSKNEKIYEELSSLKTNNTELLKNNEAFSDMINNANTEISLLNNRNSILENDTRKMQIKYDSLKNELHNLKEERDSLICQYKKLSEENSKNECNLKSMKEQHELLKSQFGELESIFHQSVNEREQLSIRYDEIFHSNERYSHLLKDLESKLMHLTEEKRDVENKFLEHHIETEKLNLTLASVEQELKSLHEARKSLEIENKDQTNVIDNLKNEIIASNKDKINFENKYTQILEINKELRENNEILMVKEINLQKEIEKLVQEYANLSAFYENSCQQIETLKKEDLAELRMQNQELTNCNSTIETKYQLLSKDYDKLVVLNNELQKNLQSIKLQNEAVLKEIEQHVSEKDLIRAAKIELENEKAIAENKNKNLEDRIEVLENSFRTTVKENRELLDKLTGIENELNDTLKQMETTCNKNIAMKIQNDELIKCNEKYIDLMKQQEQQIKDFIFTKESLAEELHQVTENSTQMQNKMEEEFNLLLRDQSIRMKQYSQLLEENKEFQKKITDLIEENKSISSQLRKSEEAKATSLNKLREMLLHQIDQLQKANEQIRSENEKLSEKNSEKLLCLKEVEKRLELLTEEMKELKLKSIELEKLNGELKKKVQESNQSESDLQMQNNSLIIMVRSMEKEKEELLKKIDTFVNNETFLNTNMNILKNEIIETITDKKELRKLVTIESQEHEYLQQNILELTNEISILKENNVKSQTITENLNRELQLEKQIIIEKFESQLRDKINELKEAQEESAKIKTRLEELQKQKEELYEVEKINKDAFDNQLQVLYSQNQSFQDDLKQLHCYIDNMEKENSYLKEKIQETECVIKTLHQENKDEKEKSAASLNEEKDRVVKISICLHSLKKEYENLKSHEDELLKQLNEKEKVVASLREEIEKRTEQEVATNEETNLNQTHIVSSGLENDVYINLRQENIKLTERIERYKDKILEFQREIEKEKELFRSKAENLHEKISQKILAEFEGKLERAKIEYQKIMKRKFSTHENEWKKKEEEYKLMLKKEKEHIRDLSSQIWDISDKYLQLKQKFETKSSPLKFRTYSEENLFSPSVLTRRTKSTSHLNLAGSRGYKISQIDRRLSTMSEDIPLHLKRRETLTTSGKKFSLSSAKVFPTEDEDQEIFDNACLADLKQGRMLIDDSKDFSKERLSVLQLRNSLCPPHLKSSYPAETQFVPPQEFRENDIKMGLVPEPDHSDIENLIPGEKLRKNRNQTSYKKPGPPTPSKNGGRSTQQDHNTPRNVLKESNENGAVRRRSFTPKFINNLFAVRGQATVTVPKQQDENVSVTPRHNRLSSIRRRFSKHPPELGNTNSGFG